MNIAELLGYLASLLVFTTFYMKTMIPLRLVAIASNVAFMAYGFAEHLYPVLILHVALLPLNIQRLMQIRGMVRRVEQATARDLDFSSLLPLMTRTHRRKGETLFNKGERADRLYYVADGKVSIPELGATMSAGNVIGEIGLFSPNRDRMATAVCDTDCEIYSLLYTKIEELHYQNPEFGFTLLRLITGRLLQDLQMASVR